MEQLIPVTNSIREALASVELDVSIDLPQIAVVGSQSVGKSSVLEALVGRTFLPSGSGIVTRRPLVLQLCNTAASGSEREWGEFGHRPGEHIEDFSEIEKEIVRDTERVCGTTKAVSSTPIVLTISSPRVIDLTLVDLPGVARVPVGDQPPDIEMQLRQLILEFVVNPRCLILAVVAGNTDLATADALALAREVDPEGSRTIGVVTKLDLVEDPADVLNVLDGRVYPLRHGYIGIVCRSSRDVQARKHVKDHLQAEAQFFQRQSAYGSVAHRCGTKHLAKCLNRLLMDHICEAMPDIKAEVTQLIHDSEIELQGYGETVSKHPSDQGALLLSLFTKYAGRFGDAIEGKLAAQQAATSGQLMGRARIDFIFRDVFAKTIQEFDCCGGLSDDEIRVAIRNATGPRATLFVPEAAFEMLVRKQIAKLQGPSLQCAELVFEELHRVLLMSELPEFRRFSNLRDQIFSVVRGILRRCLEPTIQMVKDLIQIELAYINTSHPDFVGASGAMSGAGGRRPSAPSGEPARASSPSAGEPATPADGAAAGVSSSAPSSFAEQPGDKPTNPPPLAGDVSTTSKGELVTTSSGFFSTLNFFRQPGRSSGTSETEGGAGGQSMPEAAETGEGTQPEYPHPRGRSISGQAGGGGYPYAQQAVGSGAMPDYPQWTDCPQVRAGTLRLPPVPQTITPASTPPSQREKVEVNIIKVLLKNYFAIVKKNMADSVPKAVMFFMVNALKDVIQSECVAKLYKEELFAELLREARDVQERRDKCYARLQALYKVIEVAEHVRDFVDTW